MGSFIFRGPSEVGETEFPIFRKLSRDEHRHGDLSDSRRHCQSAPH
jgi:hypothetical protein